MLEFINWFFSFFANFVDMLSRLVIVDTVTLGMLMVSAMIMVVVGRFLVGAWKNKTVGGSDDGEC